MSAIGGGHDDRSPPISEVMVSALERSSLCLSFGRMTSWMSALAVAGLLLAAPSAVAQSQVPVPEQPRSTVGYQSVSAAMEALRLRPGVMFEVQNGWTIATDEATWTIWSFAPPEDPAYPSVVKRTLLQNGPGVAMSIDVQCEARKAACDDLVRTFGRLNAQTGQALRGGR